MQPKFEAAYPSFVISCKSNPFEWFIYNFKTASQAEFSHGLYMCKFIPIKGGFLNRLCIFLMLKRLPTIGFFFRHDYVTIQILIPQKIKPPKNSAFGTSLPEMNFQKKDGRLIINDR
jgi:hypothetical protein